MLYLTNLLSRLKTPIKFDLWVLLSALALYVVAVDLGAMFPVQAKMVSSLLLVLVAFVFGLLPLLAVLSVLLFFLPYKLGFMLSETWVKRPSHVGVGVVIATHIMVLSVIWLPTYEYMAGSQTLGGFVAFFTCLLIGTADFVCTLIVVEDIFDSPIREITE